MPKRLFSDKAWLSDKLRAVQPDEFRAEYAWIYSLALCDGTFECDPQKVWAQCYAPVRQIDGRGGWSVKKVGEMLDEFDRRGLLLRKTDREGKRWGFWVGCDDCLPARGEWYKYARGKRFLFSDSESLASDSGQPLDNSAQGFGLGSGLATATATEPKNDRAAGGSQTITEAMNEIEKERQKGNDGGLKPGDLGYFARGQYRGTNPKQINKIYIARAWQRIKGESAVARYPSKYPESWESLCDQISCDLLVPAFELWAKTEGAHMDTQFPAYEFAKVAQQFTSKILPLNSARPKITADQLARTDQLARENWEAAHPGWKIQYDADGKACGAIEINPEPAEPALFGPENTFGDEKPNE